MERIAVVPSLPLPKVLVEKYWLFLSVNLLRNVGGRKAAQRDYLLLIWGSTSLRRINFHQKRQLQARVVS